MLDGEWVFEVLNIVALDGQMVTLLLHTKQCINP